MPAESESQGSKPLHRFSAWALAVGIPLCLLAGAFLLFVSSGRIDSAQEFDLALRSAPLHAAPLAIASFLTAFGIRRGFRLPFRLLCVLVASALVWAGSAQFLRFCYFSQLRSRGVDPEQVLRSVHPQSSRLR